ncbi:type VII secretion protein EssB [Pseudogracilibacillus sp. SE30717A]|uniref:type VII secretion protein EssB n=1 Tax=Pseudogracilibacillus sp. SE30717A TaxID=3098293 RepID=UPI00300DFA57
MSKKEIKIGSLSLTFMVEGEEWKLDIPKSRTQIMYTEQLKLIMNSSEYFVPLKVEEEEDTYRFNFTVSKRLKQWEQIKGLSRNKKLRALCNISKLYPLLSTRITFTFHPNNIVFDDNLMPLLVYRGIRNQLQPYELTEEDILKQYKSLVISLFSKKYTFDDLYNGSLQNATDTKFERQVNEKGSMSELLLFLEESYREEQHYMERQMQLVPKKRFRLFKQLSIWMTVLSVIVISLLLYNTFIKIPYQDRLLEAHNDFLANDYSQVIQTLKNEDVEKLPYQAKYILAYSYIKVEPLSDKEQEVIMKNISLKSDKYYLLYWIYNGLGDFDKSIDTAKYMDDPQLIIYGLIKKIEQVKNDPELTGAERDDEIRSLQDELGKYKEEYELVDEEEETKDEEEQDMIEDNPVSEETDPIEDEKEEQKEKEAENNKKDNEKDKKSKE